MVNIGRCRSGRSNLMRSPLLFQTVAELPSATPGRLQAKSKGTAVGSKREQGGSP